MDRSESTPSLTRRALLSGVTGATVATAGCSRLSRARNIANYDRSDPLSLAVKTTPADADPMATRIARALVSNLSAAGVDAQVVPMAEEELLRDVLINHEFDIYVARFPAKTDPDFLRTTFHSSFNAESGWQNPTGYSNITLDELLLRQREQTGDARWDTVADIQRHLADQQPITVVAFPDEIRTTRSDRYQGWDRTPITSPVKYLALDAVDSSNGTLRTTVTDARITRNLNPIAVEFRNNGQFTDLLYDSVGRRIEGDVRPWLATSWEWRQDDESAEGEDGGLTATVQLRSGVQWHDGRQLTASDVAFTYRLLADTWLGSADDELPAPRFRDRSSLVTDVTAVSETTVRLRFGSTSPAVAKRAFTVPVLPAHIWETRATETDLTSIGLFESTPEALVTTNIPPVGSGPLTFENQIAGETLILTRNEEHFLHDAEIAPTESALSLTVPFSRFVVQVAPSAGAAVELVEAGEADVTASALPPSTIPAIGRNNDLNLRVEPSQSFYQIGYNARRGPLGNPRFRRTLARLVDEEAIVEDVFDGYARPAISPLDGTHWVPTDLQWINKDPALEFLGTDGELDVERAQDAFREAGFRYREDGSLVAPE